MITIRFLLGLLMNLRITCMLCRKDTEISVEIIEAIFEQIQSGDFIGDSYGCVPPYP